MGKFRTSADRHQIWLFPPTIEEYVRGDDTVRYVDMLVDELDLESIEAEYSSFGRPAYSPAVLVKILLYGKIRGVRSSRELSRATRENIRFMYISSNERPDFRTISDFRKRFHRELAGLLKQTIEIGVHEGIIEMDHVAVDGTKIRASAGKRSFRTPKQLEEELEASFQQDIELDAKEDERYGDEDGDGKIPTGLEDREKMRKKIRAALGHYEEIEKEKPSKKPKKISLTDPECRYMKLHEIIPAYNAQAAVDMKSRMVVGGYATNSVSENGELPRMLTDIEANTGTNPSTLSADRGYSLKEGLHELTKRGIDGYIPQRKESSGYFKQEEFTYDAKENTYRCPNHRTLQYEGYVEIRRKKLHKYVCHVCAGCTLIGRCIRKGTGKRTMYVSIYSPLYYEMREKMKTERGKRMSKIRSSTVEPLFGHIKANRKLRQFSFRGLPMIDSMWKLELAAYNIEKLAKIFFRGSRSPIVAQ
jgi:transposase